MIRLFGAIHGMSQRDLFGNTREIDLQPSYGFIEELRQFPIGTRVGIEWFSDTDWDEVKRVGMEAANESSTTLYFPKNSYWRQVIGACLGSGHEIVYLEDKEVWFRYLRAFVALARVKAKYQELYHDRDEESERDYHRKLITLNDEVHRAETETNRIHLIERDTSMLRRIASANLDTAAAGIGHTDYWLLNRDRIRQEYGIEFGDYSTDNIPNPRDPVIVFTESAVSDPKLAYDFTGLMKTVDLFNRGQFTDKTPDWVGTWDVTQPSRGYFELFVEDQANGITRGTVEDLLGTAIFEGLITSRQVRFIKNYNHSTRAAINGGIKYNANSAYDRDRHWGCYAGGGSGDIFYMEKPVGSSPVGMSMAWFDLHEADEAGQMALF